MPNLLSRLAAVPFALAITIGAAGCSVASDTQETSARGNLETLEKLVEDGLANAPSEFQQEVLSAFKESGDISESDWKEANNRNIACFVEKGYQAEAVYRGSEVLTQVRVDAEETLAEQQARQQADLECYEKTSAYINEIYDYMHGGAHRYEDDLVERAVLACLMQRGFVPEGTGFDAFAAELAKDDGGQFASARVGSEEELARCWAESAR